MARPHYLRVCLDIEFYADDGHLIRNGDLTTRTFLLIFFTKVMGKRREDLYMVGCSRIQKTIGMVRVGETE